MDTQSRVGTTIGHIRIIEFIDAGGMGEVYLGFDETLRRTVAIKTIGTEARLHPTAKARFVREARALSQLHHPHICEIYDYIEGEDSDFLVLEHIEGTNLSKAIRSGLDRNLELSIAEQIAEVLVAAHEKGVVHRDIKPTNVMLTGDGDIKVLDFGLARLLQPEAPDGVLSSDSPKVKPNHGQMGSAESHAPTLSLDDSTETPPPCPVAATSGANSVRTVRGTVLGTPMYMSPEQARGELATAASDMYSYGLLLRELFTGRSPGKAASEPPDPTAASQPEPQRSAGGLTGDLRALVERLESPAPGARPTASEVLARLQWIRGKPKRRIRRIVIAAAVVFVILGGLKYTFDLRQERSQAIAARDQAEELVDFLIGLFEVSDPGEARGRTITAREILSRGADEVSAELEDHPATQAKLMETIGVVYTKLGLFDEARPLLERSLELRRSTSGPDGLEVSDSLRSLAALYERQGLYPEGEELARRSLAIREAELGPDHLEIAEGLHTLGLLCEIQREYEQAEEAFTRAISIREKRLGPNHPDVAKSVRELGIIYHMQGRYEEAETNYRRALAIQEKALGDDHPDVGASVNSLASLCHVLGRFDEAERLYQRALEIRERTLGPEHPDVAYCLINLAGLYFSQRRYDESEAAFRRALAIQEEALGPDHPEVVDCEIRLAQLCAYSGHPGEAEQLYRRAIATLEAAGDADSLVLATALDDLASFLDSTGRYGEAEDPARRAFDIRQRVLDANHPEIAASCFGLAHLAHRHSDRLEEADSLYARAFAIWEETLPEDDPWLVTTIAEYAALLRELNRLDEARALEARIPPESRASAGSSIH